MFAPCLNGNPRPSALCVNWELPDEKLIINELGPKDIHFQFEVDFTFNDNKVKNV